MKIILDIEKNVDQNASDYFEKAKKAKKKLEGVQKALLDANKKLEFASKDAEKKESEATLRSAEKARSKEWFEKFRWFYSSDGFLVIGGKDASSNEVVIKKYMDPDDLVFHTEAPGSPFFVVKNIEKKEIPDLTKLEAATAAATFSKAWSTGIKSLEVFEVLPEQVSKEAKSGEYIQKGAFMIYGKRNHYTPILSLAIGLLKNKDEKVVMSGPESAVKVHCAVYVVLKQGDMKKGEIAKILMKKFEMFTNDDIISALPSGEFGVVKQK